MASAPLSPEPNAATEKRLVDRSHFLGDAGRAARQIQGDEDEGESFESLLKKKVDKDEPRTEDEQAAEQVYRGAEEMSGAARRHERAGDPLSQREIEQKNQEQALKEAERHGTWRGPTLVVGLSVAGGAPLQTVSSAAVSGGERTRSERETEHAEEIAPGQAKVDPGLLEGLKASGLANPLTGLDDARLAGSQPQLSEEWRQGPSSDGVVYLWEGSVAHQKLEWGEGRALLESAAGTMIQVLERRNGQTFARTAQRDAPARRRFEVKD